MDKAVIDIFLVTYNRENYLRESIASILKQTYKEFNLIILDNCSTDHTTQVVNSFFDSRIKYIRHEKNIGGLENINYAIKHATAKYFMIFHDDDIMYETLVEKEVEILENDHAISAISCKSDCIDKNDKKISSYKWNGGIQKYKGEQLFNAYLRERCFVLFPSIIYRTEFMKKNSIYLRSNVGPSADIYMCFDIAQKGGVIAIYEQNLMAYRKHQKQDSSQHRVDMIVQLFKALNKDGFYSELLKKNIAGQKSYYKWLMHNEICMIQVGTTNCENSLIAQEKYEKVMRYSTWDHIKYKMIIFDEKYFILSKIAYRILKK